jgi:hypothetical protein
LGDCELIKKIIIPKILEKNKTTVVATQNTHTFFIVQSSGSLESAREAVKMLLAKFGGKIGM